MTVVKGLRTTANREHYEWGGSGSREPEAWSAKKQHKGSIGHVW